jgi:type II secretory pathway pseudopilin PulG
MGFPRGRPGRLQAQSGFAFFLLLAFVAVMGIGLAAVAQVWSTAVQRERERELLFIGSQLRAAVAQYYNESPGAKQYPRTLDDLLEDKRFPTSRRHLRRVYIDPMTGKAEWGLVRYQGFLIGVHSLSEGTPVKSALFDPSDILLTGAAHYTEWRFVYTPEGFESAPRAVAAGLTQNPASPAATPPSPDSAELAVAPGSPQPGVARAAAVPSIAQRARSELPTEPWACNAAARAAMRDCARLPPADVAACEQAAESQSKACLARAASAAPASSSDTQ